MRIDKLLSDAGIGTRRQVKLLIAQGHVRVDKTIVTDASCHIDPTAAIELSGVPVSHRGFQYWMLHKPQGMITATKDKTAKTVMDLLPSALTTRGLFPVGRLDKDTTGLLLITNDGELAHALLAPCRHVEKCYYVHVTGELGAKEREAMAYGVTIGMQRCRPAKLEVIDSQEAASNAFITITEGKFHQIKRMFHALGHEVLTLERRSMGSLVLDPELTPGQSRPLVKEEIQELLRYKKGSQTDE